MLIAEKFVKKVCEGLHSFIKNVVVGKEYVHIFVLLTPNRVKRSLEKR